jgi:nucleotide-binding universal stress UspA family protein
MIPEIKRVLFATDLSSNARFAFGYAVSLAERYDATITVLHVLEEMTASTKSLVQNIVGSDRWESLRQEKEKQALEIIRQRLNQFCMEMTKAVSPSCAARVDQVLVIVGKPEDEILSLAGGEDYDMVVMGTHGQGVFADAMMGSTARRVVRRCQKPVLVVRLPEDDR